MRGKWMHSARPGVPIRPLSWGRQDSAGGSRTRGDISHAESPLLLRGRGDIVISDDGARVQTNGETR